MTAYYNENEPYAAQWLRNLIDAGLIAHGNVDSRDIRDVRPSDLIGYRQCHFFAGIGGWSYAARLAGWPDDRELWTGSCPCQPFSNAGKQAGFADERHLWPEFWRLIQACQPSVVMGEQVAGKLGLGWLDRVFDDLENGNYASGATVIPACAVNAPHRRERLWWLAKRLADARKSSSVERRDTYLQRRRPYNAEQTWLGGSLGDTDNARLAKRQEQSIREDNEGPAFERTSRSFWDGSETIYCDDGKVRRVKSGVPLLVDGLPSSVAGMLAGFGNAIVPEVGAEVIRAFMECEP